MKHTFLLSFLFLFLLKFSATAQSVSVPEDTQISILTIGPGKYLYDKFGHSAFRIKSENIGSDIIYNFGTYDFDTPNFYTKFAQGKLLYALSTGNFENFKRSYVAQNRSIKEQTLDLNYSEIIALANYLNNNAKPENRLYKYDFFFDNCATRIRDVMVNALEGIHYPENYLEETKTFRELIRQNVQANSWGSLGMDVAIGAVTDIEATPWQHQYLPEYVYEAHAKATIDRGNGKQPLVRDTQTLFEATQKATPTNFFTSPLFVFGLLGFLIVLVTFRDYKKNKRSRFLDATIFLITGVIGVFILLLWFATDHSATANNYNVLWAVPISLLVIYAISKKQPKKWVMRYVMFLLVLMALMTLHWITGVQSFAIGFVPLFIALAIRYLYVVWFLKNRK